MKAFSLIEILISLLIISIVFSVLLKSITSIKKQNISTLAYIHKNASLIETQLFLNNYFALLLPESIKISKNNISWQGYNQLYIHKNTNANFMAYSENIQNYNLALNQDALFFNNNLLLKNIKSIDFNILNINKYKILYYKMCQKTCIEDYVILQELIIKDI